MVTKSMLSRFLFKSVQNNMMFCYVAASGADKTPADGADATEDTAENPEDPRSHTNALVTKHCTIKPVVSRE